MKWREFIRDYLSFTRKERIGILVIIALILLVYIFPAVSTALMKKESHADADTTWMAHARKLLNKSGNSGTESQTGEYHEENFAYSIQKPADSYFIPDQAEVFHFNPNTLSSEGWKRLGIKDRTVQTIQNYLSKGGRFRKPEDLQKIYGLSKKDYERLVPFVRIDQEFAVTPISETGSSTLITGPGAGNPPRYLTIDINLADTTAFISLPGIGSKLAYRIVTFREKLGGFYTIEQVGETYGLPDSTFQKIKQYLACESAVVKKININTATADELKAHPYIKYSLANPIIAYRNEHGPFAKIEDIKKVMAVTDDIYKKIAPYLEL